MQRAHKWWMLVGVILGAGVLWWMRSPAPLPPGTAVDVRLVDSLQRATTVLETQRDSMARAYAAAEAQRAAERQQRIRIAAELQVARTQLDSAARTLPPTLPPSSDSAQAALYAVVKAQLDAAVALVHRQAQRISADSALLVANAEAEANLLAQVFNVMQQRDNLAAVRDEWERKYRALAASQPPRCQWKCGVVLGVTGTVLTAIAVNQVQQTLRP